MMRSVRFTPVAVSDLKFWHITRSEFQHMEENLLKLAALDDAKLEELVGSPNDNWLCNVACTHNEWKRMISKPNNIRIFFVYNDQFVTVMCVERRCENTYKIAAILYNVQRGIRA